MSEITWEANERNAAAMKVVVRRDSDKYIGTFGSDKEDDMVFSRVDREEFYDLLRDPGEHVDLHSAGLVDASFQRQQARTFLDEVRSARQRQGGGTILLDEELKERLRALGYLNP